MAIVSIGVCSHLTTRRRKLWRIHTASRFCNLTDETFPTSCGSTGPVEYLSPRKTSPRVNRRRESGKNAYSVLPKTGKWAKPEEITVKQGQSSVEKLFSLQFS